MLSPMGGGFGLGRLGRVGSGQRSPYAAYALAEDFLTPQYWVGGTQYGASDTGVSLGAWSNNAPTDGTLSVNGSMLPGTGAWLNIVPTVVGARYRISFTVVSANNWLQVTAGGPAFSNWQVDLGAFTGGGAGTPAPGPYSFEFTSSFANGSIGFQVPSGAAVVITGLTLTELAGPWALPGYSYTRSGTASYVNASGGIETFAANVPPIVTGKGYMAYGALTNSLLQSQNFSTADWVAGAASITTDTVAAPDGTLTADTLTDNTATSEHRIYQSPASSVSGTASVFLQMGTCRYASLSTGTAAAGYAIFDLQAGAVASFVSGFAITAANIVACGGGWYRCNVSGGNINFVVVNMGDTAGHAVPETTWTGTGANTLHLWQAQVIPGTIPDGGPIIATTTAVASIGAGALSATINPYTTDQDFIFWAVVTFAAPVSSSKSNIIAILGSEAGPYINLQREFSSGKLKAGISGGGGDAFSGATLAGTGRVAILYRRRAGKDTCAIKSGTVTVGTESAVNTFAAVTSRLAESFTSNETDGVIEGVFAKTGTFSDADIAAILGAA